MRFTGLEAIPRGIKRASIQHVRQPEARSSIVNFSKSPFIGGLACNLAGAKVCTAGVPRRLSDIRNGFGIAVTHSALTSQQLGGSGVNSRGSFETRLGYKIKALLHHFTTTTVFIEPHQHHHGHLQGTKRRSWRRPYRYAHGRARQGAMVQEAQPEGHVRLPLHRLYGR